MGRGEAEAFEPLPVTRVASDDLADLAVPKLGALKRRLKAALDDEEIQEAFNRTPSSQMWRANDDAQKALEAGDVEEFRFHMAGMIASLEPNMLDRQIRERLYPIAYEEIYLTELNEDLAEADAVVVSLPAAQLSWPFADAPEPLQRFSEDAEADDWVAVYKPEAIECPVQIKDNGAFVRRELASGAHLIYVRQ